MIIIIAEPGKKVHLGRIGENEARAVQFDISQTQAEFPGASFSVLNMRPQDPDAYPVNGQYIRIEGSNLYWTLQSGDLTEDGLGECELKATVDGVIVKSEIWTTEICPALDGNGEPPEPWESWQQQVEEDADRAEAAAEDSEAWAVGERGGEPVPEGDETYHNNAKYWADQAEETLASKADKTDTVLNTTLSRGRKANTTVGQASFAFGYDVEASGAASHAEGYQTKASGTWSHAEGDETEASGQASHAEGYQTKAKGSYQHVSGVMNVEDNNNTFAEIVGNGFRAGSSIKRANARALDWNGNEYLKGDLYVQCDKNSQNGSKVAKVSDIPEPVDISGKADKVEGAVAGNFAGLDENGNLTDSGSKASDFLTEHQDISGKADKVTGATNGNLAGLDGSGNLTDSGKKAADFVPVTSFRADAMPMSATDPTTVAQTATELKSAIDGKADLIRDTVQNVAIASVPDGASNLPLTALRFAVEPIQAGSGDPYPAGGGVNKYSGSATISLDKATHRTERFSIVKIVAGSYTVSWKTSASGSPVVRMQLFDANSTSLGVTDISSTGSSAITLSADAVEAYFYITQQSADGSTATVSEIQIEVGSSASAYKPYSNVRPITGRTSAVVGQAGKNFLPNLTLADFDGASTFGLTTYIPIALPPGTYTISTNAPTGYLWVGKTTSSYPRVYEGSPVTRTLNEGDVLLFGIATDDKETALTYKTQIEQGSTASSYTAYTGTTATVQFGSTVFGGQIDWVNGVMVVDHVLDTMTGNDVVSVGTASSGINYARMSELSSRGVTTTATNKDQLKSNLYVASKDATVNNSIRINANTTPYAYNNDLDTLEKAQTFYNANPLQIWYPLYTPIEIPLSNLDEIRTVKGVNNLWADSGDVLELTYPCDTKLYVDKKIAETVALILEN